MQFDIPNYESKTDATGSQYSVFNVTVTTKDGRKWNTAKRYSELLLLHHRIKEVGDMRGSRFPGKKLFGGKEPSFLNKRREDLKRYLNHAITSLSAQQIRIVEQYFLAQDGSAPRGLAQPRGPIPAQKSATVEEETNDDELYKNIVERASGNLIDLYNMVPVLSEADCQSRHAHYLETLRAAEASMDSATVGWALPAAGEAVSVADRLAGTPITADDTAQVKRVHLQLSSAFTGMAGVDASSILALLPTSRGSAAKAAA